MEVICYVVLLLILSCILIVFIRCGCSIFQHVSNKRNKNKPNKSDNSLSKKLKAFLDKHKRLKRFLIILLYVTTLSFLVLITYLRWEIGLPFVLFLLYLFQPEDTNTPTFYFYLYIGIGYLMVFLIAGLSFIWYYLCGGWLVIEASSLFEMIIFLFATIAVLITIVGLVAILFGWDPDRR